MKKIGKKFSSLIVWASAYLNIVAFALCGGDFWLKSDDEDLKGETKKALIVTLIFTALNMLLSLVSQLISLCGISYGSDTYTVYQKLSSLVSLAKIIVYAAFALIALFAGNSGETNGGQVDGSVGGKTENTENADGRDEKKDN